MDLSKFVALLQTRKVWFARGDTLGDPFEGSVGIRNHTSHDYHFRAVASGIADRIWSSDQEREEWFMARYGVSDRRKMRISSEFDFEAEQRHKKIYLHLMCQNENRSRERRKDMLTRIFISCWHMNEVESAAMWKLYSSSHEAVCIQTTFEKLSNQLAGNTPAIAPAVVNYVDYESFLIGVNHPFAPFVYKRASFEHERELRFISTIPAANESADRRRPMPLGIGVEIDLNGAIEKVRVSPTSSTMFRDVIDGLLGKYEISVRTSQSSLLGTPLY